MPSHVPYSAAGIADGAQRLQARVAYNLRFPGQVFDRQAGLHYNYRRDYDPAGGGMLSQIRSGSGGRGPGMIPYSVPARIICTHIVQWSTTEILLGTLT